jgi:hypothetical protein
MSVELNTCGFNELDFFQLLAGSLVVNSRTDSVSLRAVITDSTCEEVTPLIDCDTKDIDPMELLKQMFILDNCGRIALNITKLS